MRAVVCHAYGDYHDMRVEEIPSPAMGSTDVHIRISAAGVSFANILAIAGRHQNRATPPFIPGTEVSGTVIACGGEVDNIKVGDRVIASIENGGFAEEIVAPARNVFVIPDELSYAEAVTFSTIYASAFIGLAYRAHLQPGEQLLVYGAGGASGLAAIEIGKALGAQVIAIAGSEEKLQAAKDAGAHHVINYNTLNFRDRVLELTNARGADVIFDPVGGNFADQSLRCVAPEGRIVLFGFASGQIPQLPANLLLVKNVTAIGVYWGYYMGWSKHKPHSETRTRVQRTFNTLFLFYTKGLIRSRVHGTFPLEKFGSALDIVQQRKAVGKVVLTPTEPGFQ